MCMDIFTRKNPMGNRSGSKIDRGGSDIITCLCGGALVPLEGELRRYIFHVMYNFYGIFSHCGLVCDHEGRRAVVDGMIYVGDLGTGGSGVFDHGCQKLRDHKIGHV